MFKLIVILFCAYNLTTLRKFHINVILFKDKSPNRREYKVSDLHHVKFKKHLPEMERKRVNDCARHAHKSKNE